MAQKLMDHHAKMTNIFKEMYGDVRSVSPRLPTLLLPSSPACVLSRVLRNFSWRGCVRSTWMYCRPFPLMFVFFLLLFLFKYVFLFWKIVCSETCFILFLCWVLPISFGVLAMFSGFYAFCARVLRAKGPIWIASKTARGSQNKKGLRRVISTPELFCFV